LDKQAANQLILAINELNRRLGMMGANQRPGWMRDGDSNARYGGTDSSGEKLLDKMREQRKVFDDTTKVQTRFMRTMAEGVPIIGNIVKVIGKQTEDLKMSMRGQSDAYKNAALATEEYAYRGRIVTIFILFIKPYPMFKRKRQILQRLSKIEQV